MQSKVKAGRIPIFKKRFGELANRYETRAAFADAIGLSRQSVNFWLNGDRVPDAENMISVCSKLGVSSDWLLGLTDVQCPEPEMQAAHELTQLSEKAISNIIELSKYPSALAGLNYMLQNRNELQGVAQGAYDYHEIKTTSELTIIPLGKSDNHISGITNDVAAKISALLQFEALLEKVGET